MTEITKKRPNYEELEGRINLTFSDRRSKVVNEDFSISKMKEEYTWLFKDDGIDNRGMYSYTSKECVVICILYTLGGFYSKKQKLHYFSSLFISIRI